MRYLFFFVLAVLTCHHAFAQTTVSPAPKDPQALSILNQALTAAGGLTTIKGITDYTATGTITYHWNPDEQGKVTVRGLGLDQFRVDANLSRGVRSWIISSNETIIKSENGAVWQYPPSYPVPSSDAFPYKAPIFPGSLALPHSQLVTISNGSLFGASYKGIVQVDGRAAHDIQAEISGQAQPDSMAEYRTIDLFIDTTSLQLIMVQDNIPNHIVHQIRYSNYTTVRGVLVPFSIAEQMGGQRLWDMQLTQISFNTGLQDSAFAAQ
jgi:hypothetical protein